MQQHVGEVRVGLGQGALAQVAGAPAFGAGRSRLLVRRRVDGEHARCAQCTCQAHRQGGAQVGIGITLAANAHRRELALDRHRRLHGQADVAAVEPHGGPVSQPLRHADHSDPKALQQPLAGVLSNQRRDRMAAQPFAAVAPGHARQRPGLQIQRQGFDGAPGHAGGAQRADERTGRRAHDDVGHEPEFVQCLDHTHVHEAARPARTQDPRRARRSRECDA